VAHQRDVVLAAIKHSWGIEYAVWVLQPDGTTRLGLHTRHIRMAVDLFYWELENKQGNDVQPKMKED